VIKVAVVMPSEIEAGGEFLADVHALEVAGAEWIGLEGAGVREAILLGAAAAVTERIGLRALDPASAETLQKLSRGRVLVDDQVDERWVEIEMPVDRESWIAAMRKHQAAGTTGVIVRWNPRLLDLLRNPEPDDRSDLAMSTG
jgi:hypothetical protein